MCFKKKIDWEREYDILLTKYQGLEIKQNELFNAFLIIAEEMNKLIDIVHKLLEKYGD